jgi:hypothetical protein
MKLVALCSAGWLCLLGIAAACGGGEDSQSAGGAAAAGAGGSSGGAGAGAGGSGTGGAGASSGASGSGPSGGAAGADASPGGSGGAAGASGGTAGASGGTADASGGAAGTDGGLDGGFAGLCPLSWDPSGFTRGPELSDDQVGQTFGAVEAILSGTPVDSDPRADAERIRTAVASAPNVALSGIAEDCTVLLQLSDGTPLVIYNDGGTATSPANTEVNHAPLRATHGASSTPVSPGPEQELLAAPSTVALPASGLAHIGYVGDQMLEDIAPKVEAALKLRGYRVSGGMTSADMRHKVKNLGALWLQTHTAMKCLDFNGKLRQCLILEEAETNTNQPACTLQPSPGLTAEQVQEECRRNAVDLVGDLAAYAISRHDPDKARYAINDQWIRNYWTFSANSVVMISSCKSFGMERLKDALRFAKAGTILGWEDLVQITFAGASGHFFFDRVLGGNTKDDLRLVPPQRPFSVQEVFDAMSGRGLIVDPVIVPGQRHHASLHLDPPGTTAILAPSIRNVTVGDYASRTAEKVTNTELHIFGQFGPTQGKVEVGCLTSPCPPGTEVPIKSWEPLKIVALIPTSGPGSYGVVRVKVAAGAQTLTSNDVPLTSWRGTYRIRWTQSGVYGPPGPWAQVSCSKLHFRADVHRFRMIPERDAYAGKVAAAGQVERSVDILSSAADSECVIMTGGYGDTGNSRFSFVGQTVAARWRELPVQSVPAAPEWWAMFGGDSSPAAGRRSGFDGTTNALWLTPYGTAYPTHTIGPIPPKTGTVATFENFNVPFAFLPTEEPTLPLNASYGAVVTSPRRINIVVPAPGVAELEYDLVPEVGSAPVSDTEG